MRGGHEVDKIAHNDVKAQTDASKGIVHSKIGNFTHLLLAPMSMEPCGVVRSHPQD